MVYINNINSSVGYRISGIDIGIEFDVYDTDETKKRIDIISILDRSMEAFVQCQKRHTKNTGMDASRDRRAKHARYHTIIHTSIFSLYG